MISCKESTRLSVKRQETRLSLKEWISLSFHKRMCLVCKNYDHQIQFLTRMAKKRMKDIEFFSIENEKLKDKILNK